MSKILISIKPEFVDAILTGEKKYEYRKIKCKQPVDKIVIYATSPIKKVVAEAEVKAVISGTPNEIWDKTHNDSGISKDFYDDYYRSRDVAYAYQLGNIDKFEKSKSLQDYGIDKAPQSFQYIST